MKYLHKDDDLCIRCHKCEEVCITKALKLSDGSQAAIILNDSQVTDEIINVCNQCGDCIQVCAELALNRSKNGVVLLNKKKCVGCLVCVGFCPISAMRINDDMPEPYKCIACGLCAEVCPTQAIKIMEI